MTFPIRNTTHRFVAEVKANEQQGWVEFDTHNDSLHLWRICDAATPEGIKIRVRDRVNPHVVFRRD